MKRIEACRSEATDRNGASELRFLCLPAHFTGCWVAGQVELGFACFLGLLTRRNILHFDKANTSEFRQA